ncbi:MAG: cytochrome c3 family protein [Neptuniibacter sp.]
MSNQKGFLSLRRLFILIFILPLAAAIAWAGTEYTLHKTSTPEFCGSCHSMKPMLNSFLLDSHAGNNHVGTRVNCTDCHLPQNNKFELLFVKIKSGTHDLWQEFVIGTDQIDWHAKRKNAFQYTYVSGCLKCHNNLKNQPVTENGSSIHLPFYEPDGQFPHCITCHQVGHNQLDKFLPPSKNTLVKKPD